MSPRCPSSLDNSSGEAGEGQIPGQLWVPPVVQEVFWRQLWRSRVWSSPYATGAGDDAGSAQPRYIWHAQLQGLNKVTTFVTLHCICLQPNPHLQHQATPFSTNLKQHASGMHLCALVVFFSVLAEWFGRNSAVSKCGLAYLLISVFMLVSAWDPGDPAGRE